MTFTPTSAFSRARRAEMETEAMTPSTRSWGKPASATLASSASTVVLKVSAASSGTLLAVKTMAGSGPAG